MNIYKEAIYKSAMEKEAVWPALAALAARVAPAISSATGKAMASNAVKSMATKEVAKSVGKDALLGAGLGGAIGNVTSEPGDKVKGTIKGALGGAAGFGAMGAASMAGKKVLLPALAKSKVGQKAMESGVGKYVASKPRLANAVKGAIPDAAVFGALGAAPTKSNKETYGEGVEGRLAGATQGALLGGAFGGAFGAMNKVPKRKIQPTHY
jgi:hypothetical protein